MITLAVEDLERALRFYRDGLGFESSGVVGTQWTDEESGANGAIAVFKFQSGLLLSGCQQSRSYWTIHGCLFRYYLFLLQYRHSSKSWYQDLARRTPVFVLASVHRRLPPC